MDGATVNGERRSYALLRPVVDATAQQAVRDRILEAYAEYEQTHSPVGDVSAVVMRQGGVAVVLSHARAPRALRGRHAGSSY